MRDYDLAYIIEVLGEPYSGEANGVRIGRHRSDNVAVHVESSDVSSSIEQATAYYVWDCFTVLASLDRKTLELLRGRQTLRLAEYARAVQELSAFISCAASSDGDNKWTMYQVCCLHEHLLAGRC